MTLDIRQIGLCRIALPGIANPHRFGHILTLDDDGFVVYNSGLCGEENLVCPGNRETL